MHKLAQLCIRRPVFATMLMIALVVLGAFSLQRLKVDPGDVAGVVGAVERRVARALGERSREGRDLLREQGLRRRWLRRPGG